MTPKPAPTRIKAAQHRAEGAKKVAAATAAVAFAAVVLLARVSHPAWEQLALERLDLAVQH
jgi:hypothetical protein